STRARAPRARPIRSRNCCWQIRSAARTWLQIPDRAGPEPGGVIASQAALGCPIGPRFRARGRAQERPPCGDACAGPVLGAATKRTAQPTTKKYHGAEWTLALGSN